MDKKYERETSELQHEWQEKNRQLEKLKEKIEERRREVNESYLTDPPEIVYQKNQIMDQLIDEYIELENSINELKNRIS